MSRIGKMPIFCPKDVKVQLDGNIVKVEGKKGKLDQVIDNNLEIKIEGETISVINPQPLEKEMRAKHGLYRKLISNMIEGVSKGFSKSLNIQGVGYRAELKGNIIVFTLGYSTLIEYYLEEGITAKIEDANKITISGISKERVGQVASEIRKLRPVEPYKGKGIQYQGEAVRRKVGKAGVKK